MIGRWNASTGAAWVAGQERMDRQLAPLGALARDRLALAVGERVLDVGCGCGATSLELADAVGPTGTVVGLDVSAPMLERARTRAGERPGVSFVVADAQTFVFEPASFDAVCSRFGVMFFDDPVAAFANLARAVRPGGRLAFVCWQAASRNAALGEVARVIADLVTLPPPPPPGSPGMFAFAEPGHVREILAAAGWGDVAVDGHDVEMFLAADVDEAVAAAQQVGVTADLLAAAPQDVRAAALGRLRAFYRERVGEHGIRAPAAVWVVSARR